MIRAKFRKSSLTAALLAVGFALPVLAQSTAAPGASGKSETKPSTSTATGSASPGGPAAGVGSTTPNTAAGARSPMTGSTALSSDDRKFIENAAKGGMAEVQLGKLATEKGESPQVKQFGQRMVDDHGKANSQLQQLASSKNVTLPQDVDSAHQRDFNRLQKLSGAQFDREYMKHMVSDHVKDVQEFQKTAKSAKDPDVKSFAQSTLPTLEHHLKQARADEAAVKTSAASNKQRPGNGQKG